MNKTTSRINQKTNIKQKLKDNTTYEFIPYRIQHQNINSHFDSHYLVSSLVISIDTWICRLQEQQTSQFLHRFLHKIFYILKHLYSHPHGQHCQSFGQLRTSEHKIDIFTMITMLKNTNENRLPFPSEKFFHAIDSGKLSLSGERREIKT